MKNQRKLTTLKARQDDVYRDIARVCEEDRGNIREGTICRIQDLDTGRSALFAIRGMPQTLNGHIMLDEFGRNRLGIGEQASHNFSFQKVGPLGAIKWACSAADPGARIAAWIGLWSLVLGIAGIAIGIVAL
jgi:hypothetical protein